MTASLSSPEATLETGAALVDRKLARLRDNAERFARLGPPFKRTQLAAIQANLGRLAEKWVVRACEAKRITFDAPVSGEEWIIGPGLALRNIRQLIEALTDIEKTGVPRSGSSRELPDGRLAVSVFPRDTSDRCLVPGVRAETRFLASVNAQNLREHQAVFYQRRDPPGRVVLVLGAGNVGSIPVMDVLYKLYVEGKVCLLKMSPVNDYLGPIFEQIFEPLIREGFLEIVYGGAELGRYVTSHAGIDELHMTGSSATHDAIVWGPPGPERERRRARAAPLFTKPVTSELGSITPVVIVPGRYSDAELAALTEHVAGMFGYNAGFTCLTPRMLVTSRAWPQLDAFLGGLGRVLDRLQRRYAYYPGARESYRKLTAARKELREFQAKADVAGSLPWGLVCNLDPELASERAFHNEWFCAALAEVRLGPADPVEFLGAATQFLNHQLWGTLSATLFLASRELVDASVEAELERRITELRYGCVAINQWAALGYALVSPPWGGHPTSSATDIQSGHGWVHNSPMFEQIEKVVIVAPLRPLVKSVWFPSHKTAHHLGRRLCALEAAPTRTAFLRSLSRVAWSGLRG